MTFPASSTRAAHLQSLATPFDLLVVGGGVNGLAVAWDAALAGLRVAVVDKGDWGSGTSSWSSRMIHGGLKYLEKYDVPLVRESLRDREWLLRNAPHLVKPLPFLLPFYAGNAHSPLALRLGMIAYDVLSFDKSVPRHRTFSRADLIERLPGLRRDGLQGGARYFDAQVEYAERLCVELMIGAAEAGAVPLNHVRVQRLRLAGNRVIGADVVDELTGEPHEINAAVTINVTGAWADDVLAGTPAAARRWIGGTKGTHLVVAPFEGAPTDSMYYESDDARPMMVIPWLGNYLIGSTDKRFDADLDSVSADAEEISYILHETNKLFPAANLTEESILYWYTGVRPLPFVSADRTADISRRHEIHDHAPQLEGLLTVLGGKLTTFRALAGHALAAVARKLPGRREGSVRSRLGRRRLPGYPSGQAVAIHLPTDVADRLNRIYGRRADDVQSVILADPANGRRLAGALTVGEVLFAIREEQGLRLADVLARRTMVSLAADLGRPLAGEVAAVMAAELDWDDGRTGRELASYESYLRRFTVREQPAQDA